jgi:2-aminomuconate deaminase
MSAQSEVIPGLAKPRGRFPHYRRAGDFIFVSGTSSRRPDGTFVGAVAGPSGSLDLDIRAQTACVIENIGKILEAAGSKLGDVVEVTTFLTNMADFDVYNEVYGSFFTEEGPSRTTVAVQELPHPNILIEIRAIAYAPLSRPTEGVSS